MQAFPIYRKLINNKSFYKINTLEEFEEIRIIGTKVSIQIFTAKQYPEKLLIQDMIKLTN